MNWAKNLLEPKSRRNHLIPCTYEARVSVVEWTDAYNSYFSDTICGLINYLHEKNIPPDQVSLYEIYPDHEARLETCFCIDTQNWWLAKSTLCQSLNEHYEGHIKDGNCSFRDRNPNACRHEQV